MDGSSERPLRVAWFSSGDPGSRSAYVTNELLPYLAERHTLEVFSAGGGDFSSLALEVYPQEQARERHQDWPFDVFVYNFEDAPKSEFVRRYAVRYPGIVLFHDVLFAPKRPGGIELFPSGVAESARCSIFFCERNTGEFIQRYNATVKDSTLRADGDRYTLGYPVAPELAGHRIASVAVAADPADPADPAGNEMRGIAYCGSPRLEHRAHLLLAVIAAAAEGRTLHWLLNEDEREAARCLCREFGVTAVEYYTPRTPPRWQQILSESRVAVHTWASAFGDPGPYLEMSMMAGRPAIVSDFSSTALYPDDVLWKITPGAGEEQALAQTLTSLFAEGEQCLSIAKRELARAYVQERCSSPDIAFEISLAIRKYSGPMGLSI